MKSKYVFCLSCLAALIAGCGSQGPTRAETEDLVPGPSPNRIVELNLQADLKDLPGDGRELRLWMPLLQSDAHQTVSDRRVVSPLRAMVRYDPVFGNAMMYFSGDEPLPSSLSTSVSYRVELHRCPPLDAVGTAALAPETLEALSLYLRTADREEGLKDALAVLTDRITRERAQDVPALDAERNRLAGIFNRLSEGNARLREIAVGLRDPALNARQQARRVYDLVREKLEPAGDDIKSDRTLYEAWQSGQATPLEYARITVFMLRTLGIPARVEYGVFLGESDSGVATGEQTAQAHIWVGAFMSPGFWFPMDPLLAEANPDLADYYFGTDCASRIRFGWGSDIYLVPAQIGDPLPIFFDARAEIDDKMLPSGFAVTVRDLVTQGDREGKK